MTRLHPISVTMCILIVGLDDVVHATGLHDFRTSILWIFFLWGHVQNIVYNRPIHNEEDLRNRLQETFGTTTPEIVRTSELSLLWRAQRCREK
jgi:hypothetical protein